MPLRKYKKTTYAYFFIMLFMNMFYFNTDRWCDSRTIPKGSQGWKISNMHYHTKPYRGYECCVENTGNALNKSFRKTYNLQISYSSYCPRVFSKLCGKEVPCRFIFFKLAFDIIVNFKANKPTSLAHGTPVIFHALIPVFKPAFPPS